MFSRTAGSPQQAVDVLGASARAAFERISAADLGAILDAGEASSPPRDGRAVPGAMVPFDAQVVRRDFPALFQELRPGVPLVSLDNAATSLKPWPVIRAVRE